RVERVDARADDGRQRVGLEHVHPAEAPRVVVDERPTIIEPNLDVIVDERQAVRAAKREPSRHAQVDEPEPAVVERRPQVFPGPPHPSEAAAAEAAGEVAGERNAKPRLAHEHARDRPTLELRPEPARDRLDLRELRHYPLPGSNARTRRAKSAVD